MSDFAKYLLKLKAERQALWSLTDFFPVEAICLIDDQCRKLAAYIIEDGL